ncbi:MAG: FecR domain-containing protein [Pirellulales bacterium]|nr:FecR domain-containing protein [Pirellulales bacterium]
MSAPLSPEQVARIRELIQAVYHEQASSGEMDELRQWIESSREAAWIYAQFMHLFAGLHWDKMRESEGSPSPSKCAGSGNSPVLGFLGECWHQGISFLSKSSVFSVLVAIGLPGIILLLLVVSLVDQKPPEQPDLVARASVARITRACDCVGSLGNGRERLSAGIELGRGQRLTLQSGLIEIEFANGARSILEAPTAFEVRDGNAGFLQMGRLAATVPPTARGFTIETPLATVVDLGTDFGVFVGTNGAAEAHVFVGQVDVATKTMPENPLPLKKRLHKGEALRVYTPEGPEVAARIDTMSASSDEFVRNLPAALIEKTSPRSGADRSGERLIAAVDRRGGVADSRMPIGIFHTDTAPLSSDDSGLRDGVLLYSDRMYPVATIGNALVGAEYVRTFNSDKIDKEHSYNVTLTTKRDKALLMVLIDDRIGNNKRENMQLAVDRITSSFALPGEFVDTGFDVRIDDDRENMATLSVYGATVPTADASGKAKTYVFQSPAWPGSSRLHYSIAVMAEAPGGP